MESTGIATTQMLFIDKGITMYHIQIQVSAMRHESRVLRQDMPFHFHRITDLTVGLDRIDKHPFRNETFRR